MYEYVQVCTWCTCMSMVLNGHERSCTVSYGLVRFGTVWYGLVRLCTVRYGMYGHVRSCTVMFGHVRLGTVWYGFDTLRYATATATLKKACGYVKKSMRLQYFDFVCFV